MRDNFFGGLFRVHSFPKMPKGSRKNRTQRKRQNMPKQDMLLPRPRIPTLIGSATNLGSRASVYPAMVKLDVPILPAGPNLVAGAVASFTALDRSNIPGFGSRFQNTFNEYCIVGAKLELRVNNMVNPAGFIYAFLDEKTFAVPTLAEAQQAPHLEIMATNTESPSRHTIEWKARDYADLTWLDVSVTTTTVCVKFFASVAGTLTTAATTGQIIVTGSLAVCFRGYAF